MPSKLIRLLGLGALLAAPLLPAEETPAHRELTYRQAQAAAGSDGIIIYQYGPDWNPRSVRMLKEFWKTKELESAAGGAILLTLPLYQRPTPEQQKQLQNITADMPALTGKGARVCPALIFIDKEGRVYSRLIGMEAFGDETGQEAINRIQSTLAHLRQQQKLLQLAERADGQERAKLLAEACDIPIALPTGVKDMLAQADPDDELGYTRRLDFNALHFLYEQMETSTGFVSKDFFPNYKRVKEECFRIINDTALRTEDRQLAYCLLIGMSRKEPKITAHQLKKMIEDCGRIDPGTIYGKLTPALAQLWPELKAKTSAEDRKAERAARREAQKKSKEEARREKEKKRAENAGNDAEN